MIESILTMFGVGKSKKAPGTMASLVTVIIWLIFNVVFDFFGFDLMTQNMLWLLICVIVTAFAIITMPLYNERVREVDHSSIVIDEFVGQILTLIIAYPAIGGALSKRADFSDIIIFSLAAFALFRFFDIRKPSVIGWLDRHLKTPFGVMLDDILAGIFSAIIILLMTWISRGL